MFNGRRHEKFMHKLGQNPIILPSQIIKIIADKDFISDEGNRRFQACKRQWCSIELHLPPFMPEKIPGLDDRLPEGNCMGGKEAENGIRKTALGKIGQPKPAVFKITI